jgi:hypothetical protein
MKTETFIFYSPCLKTKVASFFGIFTLAPLREIFFFPDSDISLAKSLSRKVFNFRPKKIYQLKLRTLASLRPFDGAQDLLCEKYSSLRIRIYLSPSRKGAKF